MKDMYLQDILQEWYFSEALVSLCRSNCDPFLRSNSALLRDVVEFFIKRTDTISSWFFSYLTLAAGCEMGHEEQRTKYNDDDYYLVNHRLSRGDKGRSVVASSLKSYTAESILSAASILFGKKEWKGHYGGEKWARIVKVVKMLKVNPVIGLDTIFSIVHNGGCLFNKPDCRPKIYEDRNTVIHLLDYKRKTDNILYGSGYLIIKVSTPLLNLLKRAKTLLKTIRKIPLFRYTVNDREEIWTEKHPLTEWGDEKVEIGYGERPYSCVKSPNDDDGVNVGDDEDNEDEDDDNNNYQEEENDAPVAKIGEKKVKGNNGSKKEGSQAKWRVDRDEERKICNK